MNRIAQFLSEDQKIERSEAAPFIACPSVFYLGLKEDQQKRIAELYQRAFELALEKVQGENFGDLGAGI